MFGRSGLGEEGEARELGGLDFLCRILGRPHRRKRGLAAGDTGILVRRLYTPRNQRDQRECIKQVIEDLRIERSEGSERSPLESGSPHMEGSASDHAPGSPQSQLEYARGNFGQTVEYQSLPVKYKLNERLTKTCDIKS